MSDDLKPDSTRYTIDLLRQRRVQLYTEEQLAAAIARAERAEKSLVVAAQLVDAIWNQWRDECWTGTLKGCKCEVVGFLRPYCESKLQHIEDVSKTIRGSIAALKGGAESLHGASTIDKISVSDLDRDETGIEVGTKKGCAK